MARKTRDYTVPSTCGRDAGKTFRITEASAMRVEKWAAKAISAAASSGQPIPGDLSMQGVAALLQFSLKSVLTMSFEAAEPLLDEMLSCVELVPDIKARPHVTIPLDDDCIEEVKTLLYLRNEVIDIHTGFSIAALLSKLGGAAAEGLGLNTETSPTNAPS